MDGVVTHIDSTSTSSRGNTVSAAARAAAARPGSKRYVALNPSRQKAVLEKYSPVGGLKPDGASPAAVQAAALGEERDAKFFSAHSPSLTDNLGNTALHW